MKKHSHDDPLATSALLDQDAEAFAKKMFKHAQSRAQERWIDMEKTRKGKKSFTTKWKSRRDEIDLL